MQSKKQTSKYSHEVETGQTLARIPPARLTRFLFEFTNLRDDGPALQRLRHKFGDIIPKWEWKPAQAIEISRSSPGETSGAPAKDFSEVASLLRVAGASRQEISAAEADLGRRRELVSKYGVAGLALAKLSDEELDRRMLYQLRDALRGAWREPDRRTREWRVLLLKQKDLINRDGRFAELDAFYLQLPPPSPFEQALTIFLRSGDRAHYCGNPDCPAPHFLAKRRSQRFCSDACALPAQREFKRQWWREHGEEWRKGRKASGKKSQRKRGQ